MPTPVQATGQRRPPVGLPPQSAWALFGANFIHPFHSDAVLAEQISFYHRLAALLQGGIPIYQALSTMAGRPASGPIRALLCDAQSAVERGEKLTDAFARHPAIVADTHLEMLRASEQAGRLDTVLGQTAAYLEREQELRRLLRRWTLYSKTTLVSYLFVIPAFTAVMNGGSVWDALIGPLPGFLELFVIFCLGYAAVRTAAMRSPAFREAYERAKWLLPGVGGVARRYALVRFGRAFGALHAAGVTTAVALRLAGRASGSPILLDATEKAARSAEQGNSPLDALRSSKAFPPLALEMLQTGEESGRTEEMTLKMAEYVEDDAGVRSQQVAYVVSQVVLLVALFILSQIAGGLGLIAFS